MAESGVAGQGGAEPRKGTGEKRQALLRGARTVFGRDGYTRAGVDDIAAEAGVSTRTLYNHFGGKENLFRAVLLDSAASVTSAYSALIERHLGKVTDIEADIAALAREWMERRAKHAPHILLVRQIIAEGSHLPADVLEEWQRIGPRATTEAVRVRFVELGARGLLAVDESDAGEAARYFALLTAGSVTVDTFFGVVPMGQDEIDARVESGVRAFLRLYGVVRAES